MRTRQDGAFVVQKTGVEVGTRDRRKDRRVMEGAFGTAQSRRASRRCVAGDRQRQHASRQQVVVSALLKKANFGSQTCAVLVELLVGVF